MTGLPGKSLSKLRILLSKGGMMAGMVLGRMTSTSVRPWAVLIEIAVVPLMAIFIGLWVSPEDPLWINAEFPWVWFAPALLALRYGPLSGVASSAFILAAWMLINFGEYDHFPKPFFLGGLILIMLVGEFSSVWLARTRRAETIQHYLDQRLEQLTRQYYLLRLSHDRLEQDLISRPMSMRDALLKLRGLRDNVEAPTESAMILLRLLAQYCQLESVSLHAMGDKNTVPETLASIGNVNALDLSDPLVRQAIDNRQLCHVRQSLGSEGKQSRYLIAAPLIDLNSKLYGLLTVEEMPFFSLQDETLQTINLLLGYFTDGLATATLAAPILEKLPMCPPEFAFEVQRLWHLGRTTGIPSVIVALELLPRAIEQDLPLQIHRMKRGLDENWLIIGGEKQLLATLMPLGDFSTADGYVARLEGWAQQKTGGSSLAELGIFPHTHLLDSETPTELLQRLNRQAYD